MIVAHVAALAQGRIDEVVPAVREDPRRAEQPLVREALVGVPRIGFTDARAGQDAHEEALGQFGSGVGSAGDRASRANPALSSTRLSPARARAGRALRCVGALSRLRAVNPTSAQSI